MDLALKKIELINWLTKQDKTMIEKIEGLRKSAVENSYEQRMNETLELRLIRSQSDIDNGHIYNQEEVESYFKGKTNL